MSARRLIELRKFQNWNEPPAATEEPVDLCDCCGGPRNSHLDNDACDTCKICLDESERLKNDLFFLARKKLAERKGKHVA